MTYIPFPSSIFVRIPDLSLKYLRPPPPTTNEISYLGHFRIKSFNVLKQIVQKILLTYDNPIEMYLFDSNDTSLTLFRTKNGVEMSFQGMTHKLRST